MRRIENELLDHDVAVAVVTFQADFMARAYAEETGLSWPLLVDGERSLYKAYDMLEAGLWDIWGPQTWWAYARELWRGQRLVASEADVSQRGGDVLIDPQGRVRLHHVGNGPADRPGVDEIMAVVRSTPRAARPSPDSSPSAS